MKVKIGPFSASGEITAPPSKSFAHRYLIAAFLSGGKCLIKNAGDSDDVKATVAALTALGGKFENKGDGILFIKREPVKTATVFCGESGSTLRFLMPVAAALGINAEFTGKGKLLSRPLTDLADAVKGHGAEITGHSVKGKLKSGKYELNAGLSSQFLTGLLFALSVLDGESEITLKGKIVSAGYVDATVEVLKEFGVKLTKTERGYKIQGGYSAVDSVSVEGDWSGAAFMLSIGALTGNVAVKNLKYPTLQPDGEIVNVLRRFGAKLTVNGDIIRAEKVVLKGGFTLDVDGCPDIAQVICALAAFCDGNTVLKGVDRLKIKESDRIGAIINTLAVYGVKAVYENDEITVFGGNPKGGVIDGGRDHRTVMSAAVMAAAANGESNISDAEYCAKSYPSFFKDLVLLGGNADVGI